MGGTPSDTPTPNGGAPSPATAHRRLGEELRSRSIVITGGSRPAAYRSRRVIMGVAADRVAEIVDRLSLSARSASDRPEMQERSVVGGRCTILDVLAPPDVRGVTRATVETLRGADVPARYNTVYFGQALPSVSPLSPALSAQAGLANVSTAVPAPPPIPWSRERPAEEAPLIAILDTGLNTASVDGARVPAHEWLRGHVEVHQRAWEMKDVVVSSPEGPVVLKAADEDLPDENRDDVLDRQAGHGTFIAGIVRRLAPHARIHVDGCLTSFGDGDDESITRSLGQLARRVDRRHRLDRLVVNLSFGGYTEDDEPPPLLAEAIAELAAQGVAFVAAAGNDDTSRKLWPAALPGVVAVAALDSAAGKAWFSNYGGWVDACAPGVDLVSTFFHTDVVSDPFTAGLDRGSYEGFAMWSGTSFAAPRVAAAISHEMKRRGVAAADAARALVEGSEGLRIPDLGLVVNAV